MPGKHRVRATAYSSILSLSSKPVYRFDVSHILCDRLMMIHRSSRVGELIFGSVAQWIEHLTSNEAVEGSSPSWVTNTAPSYIGSTRGFGPCGRGSIPLGVTTLSYGVTVTQLVLVQLFQVRILVA